MVAFITVGLGCSPSRDELRAELDQTQQQLQASQAHAQTLEQRIAELEAEITDREQQIAQVRAEMGAYATDLEELREAKRKREAELATYKTLFAKLKELIDAGTVRVVFRKGKMMVEMSSAVLFDSGKAILKPDGQVTLNQLNAALSSVGDRDFLVAGHTDNVPIKTRKYKDNWELSTARAVVVVNHMLEQGFPRKHLGAAGYADVEPVASNDTEEGRSQNRRIDIILMPDLGELEGIREMLEGGS
jgi:chemotaxis protein MotB